MTALVDKMSPPLAAAAMVQEQLGLALNRSGQAARAERVLKELIARRGPSSETCSILGRVYKGEWAAARADGQRELARSLLDRAIEAYLGGFEADWRDAYPGVNALTLMEIRDPPDLRREELLPVVDYALERRLAAREPDYWDRATRLELAVLAGDRAGAEAALGGALASVREPWEPESTADNLRLVSEARAERGERVEWADALERALRERAGG
jgi:hypothetical protein